MKLARRLPALALVAAIAAIACADTFTGTATPPALPLPLALGMDVHAAPAPVVSWMQRTGIRWTRVTYYYQTVGDSTWTADLAGELAALHAAGLAVDLVVHSVPWNDPDGVGIPHAVADLLRDHPGEIAAVELYNEENLGLDYWRPVLPGATDSARGMAYAARYRAMHDSIAGLIPLMRVPVVTGGTAGSPRAFLAGIRAAGVTPDIVGIHAYGFPPAAQLDQFTRESRSVFPGVPVWATEVGSEGGRTDSTTLALDLGGVVAWMRDHPDVRAFWYCVWGDSVDGILGQHSFTPRPGTAGLPSAGPFR